jgi:dTDP-4-dehydrorhamnose 3,5-epimerase-like enzyme
MQVKLIEFSAITDGRGSLISLEELKNVPFVIRRVYYMYGMEASQERGKHAHKELEQLIICLFGGCTIILDDGRDRQTVNLDNPSKGLYIEKNIWREMKNFSEKCVLLVLASEYYHENDYIRDYGEFRKLCLK